VGVELENRMMRMDAERAFVFTSYDEQSIVWRMKDREYCFIRTKGNFMNPFQKVVEIIYLPTMRCNCRCSHCGIRFDRADSEEMGCAMLSAYLCSSRYIAPDVDIQITGGEPFLKEDLIDFVAAILREFTSCRVSITTNGTLPQRISTFLKEISEEYIDRLHFALSIDGIEDTHDRIRRLDHAFNLAIQSARVISEHRFSLSINTVIHHENLAELDVLKAKIMSFCGVDIAVNFIPICTDVSLPGSKFPYSDEELKVMFPYLRDVALYKKYICSRGCITTEEQCHAGESNVVLLPSGGMYTCVFASAYKADSNQYCMGYLHDRGFDDIWEHRSESGALDSAKNCPRCNNPCDINRENRSYGFSYDLEKEEIVRYFSLSNCLDYWGDGWHILEVYSEGSHRWMANHEAVVYFASKKCKKCHLLKISYMSNLPELYYDEMMMLDVSVNDVICLSRYPVKNVEDLYIPIQHITNDDIITVRLVVNHLWKPSEVFKSDDTRELGIAVRDISLCEAK